MSFGQHKHRACGMTGAKMLLRWEGKVKLGRWRLGKRRTGVKMLQTELNEPDVAIPSKLANLPNREIEMLVGAKEGQGPTLFRDVMVE